MAVTYLPDVEGPIFEAKVRELTAPLEAQPGVGRFNCPEPLSRSSGVQPK